MPATNIKEALVAFLKADTAVAAVVGTRVYPQARDQRVTTLPAIVYSQVGAERPVDNAGPSGEVVTRMWLILQATTEAAVSALAKKVREAVGSTESTPVDTAHEKLHGFRGTMDGITVNGCFLEDERDEFSPDIVGADVGVRAMVLEFNIHHRE